MGQRPSGLLALGFMTRQIARLNELLRTELGENPRYSWRHSATLMRVMEAVDADGRPEYETYWDPDSLLFKTKRIMRLRPLCPDLQHQWVLCALVKMTEEQGRLAGTGEYAWIPVRDDRTSEPCALPTGIQPDQNITAIFIEQMRAERVQTPSEKVEAFAEAQARFEKQHEARCFDAIRDAGTAFYQVPGKKGSASFPSHQGETNVNVSNN